MADQKLTALTEDTAPASTDYAYTVKDPAGTPLSRRATWLNILKGQALGILTSDGDLFTRAAGALTRITRASLAADTAFSSLYNIAQVYLPAGNFAVVTGTPVLSDAGTDVPAYLMDAGSSERVATTAWVPSGWATYDAKLVWTNAGAGSGNVVWQLSYKLSWGDGESIVVDTSPANATVAAPVQDTAKYTTMVSGVSIPTSAELATFRITRVGGDAGDTLANDAGFVGLLLSKAS